ncbi:MAG: hypothetical protein ACLQAH_14295 [Limisphaerales bacterium]
MKTLRQLHLYLGCIFAPMLMFFAVSGLWQMHLLPWPRKDAKSDSIFAWLSTIHTGHALKAGTLSSSAMNWLVVAMALSLIFTIILGIMMAFRFGHQRIAAGCLLGGIVVPTILALVAFYR